jgi:hypothetical protein
MAGLVEGIASSSTGTRCKGGNSSATAAAETADNAAMAINVGFIDLSPVHLYLANSVPRLLSPADRPA